VSSLTIKDILVLSAVLAFIIGTMAFFLSLFAQGVEGSNLEASLRIAVTVALVMFLLLPTYAFVRRFGVSESEVAADPVETLRAVLLVISQRAAAAPIPQGSAHRWSAVSHIRDSRGTPVIDLHDLPLQIGSGIPDLLVAARQHLGRIRIVVGRSRSASQGGVDRLLREAMIQRLRVLSPTLDWQVIIKPGTVTLRPMGKAPTVGIWLKRFIIGVVPIGGSFAFAFRDLAGSTMSEQGFWFGLISGVFLTAMLASHRDRSG
jgi:hypothetical protein